MIEFLTLQVRMGRITIDQVPDRYRDQVAARLAEVQE